MSKKEIYDLIYGDDEDTEEKQKAMMKQYPDCKIKDASDWLHQGRFSIEMEVDTQDYFLFLMRSGIALSSFMTQTTMMDNEDVHRDAFIKAMEIFKSENGA